LSLSDICGSGGAPLEGEQEGESPAFRAGKGQAFLTCEPREGHRESVGAKGQWYLLVKNTTLWKVDALRRALSENQETPVHFTLDTQGELAYILGPRKGLLII
jgi:hypothetical protein